MMKIRTRSISWLLVLILLAGMIPPVSVRAASAPSTASGNGITITQKAEWDDSIPGQAAVKVTMTVESQVRLTTAKDIVFVVDHAANEPLAFWKDSASKLIEHFKTVPGMRYALVSFATQAETLLDFTGDSGALLQGVNGISAGVNRDGYAALRAAQDLIARRADKSRAACILLLSSGRFNLNVQRGYDLAEEIQTSVPIYAVKQPQTISSFVGTPIPDMSLKEAAMAAGEAAFHPNVTITGGPGDGFTYTSGGLNDSEPGSVSCENGVFTYRTGRFRMGQALHMRFCAVLDDRSRTGLLEAAKAAVMQGEGLAPLTVDACSLERSSLTVTYNANGADQGTAPVDSGRYAPGATVTVKPASLKKDGWNFSGWTHPSANIQDGTFAINGDTELKAAWGRAYVKLSSSTFSSKVKGTHLLSREMIEKRYAADKAFYNTAYWDHLATVNLLTSVAIPAEAEAQWDVTDTANFPDDEATAVMAWVVPNAQDGTKYDLYIGGRGALVMPADCKKFFLKCPASKFNGLENLDTSNVTSMNGLFALCKNVTELDLSHWDTSSVTDMSCLITSWYDYSTHLETYMDYMKLETLRLNGWDVSNVVNMASMFYGCGRLKELTGEENWDVSKVENMYQMFRECGLSTGINDPEDGGLFLENWNPVSLKYLSNMFYGCGSMTTLNLSGWGSTQKIVADLDISSMFKSCGNLEEIYLPNWDTSQVMRLEYMFDSCRSLKKIQGLEDMDVSRAWDMSGMFQACYSLPELDLSKWNTVSMSNPSRMFQTCKKLETVNVTGWNTEKVTNMSDMFGDCSSLTNVIGLDTWNTSNVLNMQGMFLRCAKLTFLDMSKWDMSKVGSNNKGTIYYMFSGCTLLTDINRASITVADGCPVIGCARNSPLEDHLTVYSVSGQKLPHEDTARSAVQALRPAADPGLEDPSETPSEDPNFPETPPADPAVPSEDPAVSETPKDPESPEISEPPAPSGNPEPSEPSENPEPSEDSEPSENPELSGNPANDGEGGDSLLLVRNAPAPLPNYEAMGGNGRPIYACKKIGLWNCGEVDPGQTIEYSLEVQYLNDGVSSGGASGVLTVVNPLPAGLTYRGDAEIKPVQRVSGGDGGLTGGEVLQDVSYANHTLTFTVSGLSAGAKFVMTYSCAVPNPGPLDYTEFLNTATVEDGGLTDISDPVLHYMNGGEARWYTVTYSYNNPPAGAAVPAPLRTTGGQITLPSPTAEGSQFLGWFPEGGDVGYSGGQPYNVTGDIHFVGRWKTLSRPEPVKLEYRFADPAPENGAFLLEMLKESAVTSAPAHSTVSVPRLSALPEGWTFRWQYPAGLTVDSGGTFNVKTAADWPNGTISIVGLWEKDSYDVTYRYSGPVPGDASPLPAAASYPWGTEVPLAPEPSGSALFLGWSGVENSESGRFTMPMEDVEIIGTWQVPAPAAVKEVKIDPNGGSWNGSEEDAVLTLAEFEALDAIPDPVRPGYEFLSWTESSGGGFEKILTASWKSPEPPPPAETTVTFDSQGGTPVPSQSAVPGGKVREPQDPVREGYVFQGWHRDVAGTRPWNFETDVVSGNLTLYAKWEKGLTVRFDSQGGTPVPDQTAVPGGKVLEPERPLREGHAFQGWHRDPEGTLPWSFETDTVSEDMTLYAKWEKLPGDLYTIGGIVRDPDGNPIPGVLVRVIQGNKPVFKETRTGRNGDYTFEGVPGGIYNVVAITDEGVTATILSVVKRQDLSNQDIQLSRGNTNSILQVDKKAPDVVVGGLKAEADKRRKDSDAGVEVLTVNMDVSDVTKTSEGPAAEQIQAIREEARRRHPRARVDLVLDICMDELRITASGHRTEGPIHSTGDNVLEIVIPYNLRGKQNVCVHRFHDDGEDREGAVTFDQVFARPERGTDKTFFLDRENGLVHIFAKKFSLYAISSTLPEPDPQPSREEDSERETRYIITASAGPGGSIAPLGRVPVSEGANQSFAIRPEAGYVIQDVLVDKASVGAVGTYTFKNVREDHTIRAVFSSAAQEEEGTHREYFHGFRDGTFRPRGNLTRGETAQIFYNLLPDQNVPLGDSFPDATPVFETAIRAMSARGVMRGLSDGTFQPGRAITRAEFVVAAIRYTGKTVTGGPAFSDVTEEDWFYDQVTGAAGQGWVQGYGDGTFRPYEPITRAEAAAALNRILGRAADRTYVDLHAGELRRFPDVPADHWAYYDIMESANAHVFHPAQEEIWLRLWDGKTPA